MFVSRYLDMFVRKKPENYTNKKECQTKEQNYSVPAGRVKILPDPFPYPDMAMCVEFL